VGIINEIWAADASRLVKPVCFFMHLFEIKGTQRENSVDVLASLLENQLNLIFGR
jgi:hypothetical protein